jgi:membrane protein
MASLNPFKAYDQLHNVVWTLDLSQFGKAGTFLLQLVRVCILLVRQFQNRQIRLRAMGLVYLTLMSAVPVLAFTFSILQSFGIHNRFRDVLLTLVEPLGEQGNDVVDQVLTFVDSMQIQGLGLAGVLVLLFATLSALQMIESTLNEVWHVRKPRSFLERFQTYFLIITIGPILAFSALAFTAGLASNGFVTSVREVAIIGPLLAEAGRWLTFAIAVAGFTFLFWVMPHAKVKFFPALWASVISAGAWMLVGWFFAMLIVSSGRYDAIYSAFATLVLFMFWIFLSWMVVLIGSRGSYLLQYPEYIVDRPVELELSIADQELLALRTLQLIGQRHYCNEDPHTFDSLNGVLHVPWQALEITLEILQRGRYVGETNSDPTELVAVAPFEDILVMDALAHFRRAGKSQRRKTLDGDQSQLINRYFENSDNATEGGVHTMTLKDLALEESKDKPELLIAEAGKA